MKQPMNIDTDDKAINKQILYRLREGFIIMNFTVAIFLLLALVSYHPSDPGWSTTGTGQTIANAAGKVGAWFADFCFSLLGYVAYLLPLSLAYYSWIIARNSRWSLKDSWLFISVKVFGLLLVTGSCCGLTNLHLHHITNFLPLSAGGIIGALVGDGLANMFNVLGASLILLAWLLLGITLLSGWSWITLARFLGKISRQVVEKFYRWIKALSTRIPLKRQVTQSQPKVIDIPIAKPSKPPKTREQKTAKLAIVKQPKKIKMSDRAAKDSQIDMLGDETSKQLPSLHLLDLQDKKSIQSTDPKMIEEKSKEVEQVLTDFGIAAQVVAVHPGPVVTRYELQLAPGIKVSRITALVKDLARALLVVGVRVVEVIPGKSTIGIELPNEVREVVRLREILSSAQYEQSRSPLSLALGKDIAGNAVIVDLAKMPHLLVAGTTGAGKSVGLNAMLLSLLYKSTPNEVRLIMVDPKMLELSIYEGIPHLLAPVVTDMKEAANALRWCVAEMERRYFLMASLGVRNLAGYNRKVQEAINKGEPLIDNSPQAQLQAEPEFLQTMPNIVVIIDEFADLMLVVGKKIEQLIARIAQKARAAGIHLILATQRPSVDVITGLIKANIPTRISFQVSSKIDSRTILDQQGAEQLLGHGDMLYLAPGTGVPVRVHGAFIADQEVHNVVKELRKHGMPTYQPSILSDASELAHEDMAGSDDAEKDEVYDQAVSFVLETRKVSISLLQRRFKLGYNRAARIVEQMEMAGLVSAMDGNHPRQVLVPDRSLEDK